MKTRILLTALLGIALGWTTAEAQPTLTKGAENKKVEPEFLTYGVCAGEYEGLSCWVGPGRRHTKQVVLFDKDMQVRRAMQLTYKGECEVLATSINGRRLTMLTVDRSERRQTLVYTAEVDLDSMKSMLEGGDFVMTDSITYGRRDVCHIWTKTSPNGQYTGYINIIEYTESQQYSAQITMLGRNLRPLWTAEYALGAMYEMIVSDDGKIATMAYENTEGHTVFTINMIDSLEGRTFEVEVKGEPIRTMNIAGIVDHRLIGIGTYRPMNSRGSEDICGGVATIAVDIDSGSLAGFNMRRFNNEDINIFLNKKTKKIQSYLNTDHVELESTATTSWGVVAVLGRNFIQSTVMENGVEELKYVRMGLHVVGVDKDGNISWTRNLRRHDEEKKENMLLNVAVAANGDEAVLLKSEAPKMPAIYDIAKEALELSVGDKSNLTLYRFSPLGDVSKHILEPKTKHTLLTAKQIAPDTLLVFTAAGSRSRAAELKLK